MTDLVTFGETMLRLSTPDAERLEQVESLDVHVGGAESNVAVAVQRLGLDAAWLSKLPDDPLGRSLARRLTEHGLDVEVTWSDEGKQGVYFVESAPEPRGTDVIYDREGTAVQTTTPADLPLGRVRAAEAFFTTGITPALSETLRETTAALLKEARAADVRTGFDLNYRSKLWSPEDARAALTELLPLVDVLFVADRDATDVLGIDDDAAGQARRLADEYDCETVVVTRGAEGALALHDGDVVKRGAFETGTVDPIGSGDAFVGGFLARYLDGADVDAALEYGAATAALKRTMPGDVARVSPAEVERLVEGDAGAIDR